MMDDDCSIHQARVSGMKRKRKLLRDLTVSQAVLTILLAKFIAVEPFFILANFFFFKINVRYVRSFF